MLPIEDLAVFCKKKGFVYPNSEIYGGYSGFFDYGPLGVEVKNKLRENWWKIFVQNRDDVVGIDGAQIANPKVWKASGHVDSFEDVLVEDTKTQERYRADHLVEEALKINAEGLSPEDLWKLIQENNIKSPKGNPVEKPKQFNLMFKTNVGPVDDSSSVSYLRPETAQLIFTNFRLVEENARLKLPFGIAQIGKAFRNEISPREFLFRTREFEQMEIEFFVRPKTKKCPLLTKRHTELEFNFWSKADQKKKTKQKKLKLSSLIKRKLLGEWHAYWLAESYLWFTELGIQEKNLRIREHTDKELSHYSSATFDIDYKFPFGWKEIYGNADRGQFDLKQHEKHSGKSMEIYDIKTQKKILPKVIEPSFGLDRAFLTFMYDAYNDDKKRGNIVLKLHPKIAPYQIAVFPLINKIEEEALEVYLFLKNKFPAMFDRSGSIGRRYARADEIGIPYCITYDFDSKEDKSVTIRDRDTTEQIRVKLEDLSKVLYKLLNGVNFKKQGKEV